MHKEEQMNPLEKYKGVTLALKNSRANIMVTAFGHQLGKQNGWIDEALMNGKKSLREIANFLKDQPDLEKQRRSHSDESLRNRIKDHLRWLAGEDMNNGFREQLAKVSEYTHSDRVRIHQEVTNYVRPLYFKIKEEQR
jgi:hypothetical protein